MGSQADHSARPVCTFPLDGDPLTDSWKRYLISYLFSKVRSDACTVFFLRAQNALVVSLLLPYVVKNICEHLHPGADSIDLYATWTAVNVSLFPILFFFSALYYTDIGATFWVLVCYLLYLERRRFTSSFLLPRNPIVRDVALVGSSLVALFFRQTNIFWVAIFPAALELVRTVKGQQGKVPAGTEGSSYQDIFTSSWNCRKIYDPAIGDAYFEGQCSVMYSPIKV